MNLQKLLGLGDLDLELVGAQLGSQTGSGRKSFMLIYWFDRIETVWHRGRVCASHLVGTGLNLIAGKIKYKYIALFYH